VEKEIQSFQFFFYNLQCENSLYSDFKVVIDQHNADEADIGLQLPH